MIEQKAEDHSVETATEHQDHLAREEIEKEVDLEVHQEAIDHQEDMTHQKVVKENSEEAIELLENSVTMVVAVDQAVREQVATHHAVAHVQLAPSAQIVQHVLLGRSTHKTRIKS